jgi:ribonuclease P protein component
VLPRKARLPRVQFPTVLKSGRRLASAHFLVVVGKESTGYAVVLSKKTAKLSVTRHRLKRRVLAILRTLPLPPSLIIFPKSSADSVSYKDMKAEIGHLLSSNKNI